jgi:hypothetical protein
MEIKDYFFDHGQLYDFTMEAYSFLGDTGINLNEFKHSHFCFRPATIQNYCLLRNLLLRDGGVELLAEEFIGERLVGWFKYDERRYTAWYLNIPEMWGETFPYLELVSPKDPNEYPQAFTHLAFTLPNSISLLELMNTYPGLNWIHDKIDTHGIIELHKSNSMQVKFHKKSVAEIVDSIKK